MQTAIWWTVARTPLLLISFGLFIIATSHEPSCEAPGHTLWICRKLTSCCGAVLELAEQHVVQKIDISCHRAYD